MKLKTISEIQLKTPLTNIDRSNSGGVLSTNSINDLFKRKKQKKKKTNTEDVTTQQEMLISEIFDSPTSIKWKKKTNSDWVGLFKINNKQYYLNIMHDYGMPWEIKFELMHNGKKTQKITGTGDAAVVFATVLDGIKQWLQTVKPNSFVISARESNRQSLYRRLLKILPSNWRIEDLGSTFFAFDKTAKQEDEGFGDDEFDDYYDY